MIVASAPPNAVCAAPHLLTRTHVAFDSTSVRLLNGGRIVLVVGTKAQRVGHKRPVESPPELRHHAYSLRTDTRGANECESETTKASRHAHAVLFTIVTIACRLLLENTGAFAYGSRRSKN
eukprot:3075961-Pyramimonas_sp.AAC.2